jgi:DNA replication protein DnaC
MGYLTLRPEQCKIFFKLMEERYRRRASIITTNVPFSDWPTILPKAGSAVALIDRLVHHAEIITIEGASY